MSKAKLYNDAPSPTGSGHTGGGNGGSQKDERTYSERRVDNPRCAAPDCVLWGTRSDSVRGGDGARFYCKFHYPVRENFTEMKNRSGRIVHFVKYGVQQSPNPKAHMAERSRMLFGEGAYTKDGEHFVLTGEKTGALAADPASQPVREIDYGFFVYSRVDNPAFCVPTGKPENYADAGNWFLEREFEGHREAIAYASELSITRRRKQSPEEQVGTLKAHVHFAADNNPVNKINALRAKVMAGRVTAAPEVVPAAGMKAGAEPDAELTPEERYAVNKDLGDILK